METKRIRYLLGLCSQAEREQIESEYFEDDHAFQEMLTAENDLIDAYARGKLTRDERRRFEKYFLTSLRDRDRIQFARAFGGVVSDVPTVETRRHATLLDVFNAFRGWPGALRSATITAVVVLVIVFSWLFVQRRRMNNELRADHAKVGEQTEALRRSADAEPPRSAETKVPLENLPAPSHKSRRREGSATDSQQASRSANSKLKNNRGTSGDVGPEHTEQSPSESGDTSTRIAGPAIAQLPRDNRNVLGLMSLRPTIVARLSLLPRSRTGWDGNTFTVARSVTYVVLRLNLETAPQHSEYRVILVKAESGHTLVINFPQFKPDRDSNSIDSFRIPSYLLDPGIYELYLTGKDSSGSFVRVAEYAFIVIRGPENVRRRFEPDHR